MLSIARRTIERERERAPSVETSYKKSKIINSNNKHINIKYIDIITPKKFRK